VLGKLTRQDQADAANGLVDERDANAMEQTYEVWISRDEMVDFLLYAASLEASVATRSKMSDEMSQLSMPLIEDSIVATYR
jgi:hypothetical protein